MTAKRLFTVKGSLETREPKSRSTRWNPVRKQRVNLYKEQGTDAARVLYGLTSFDWVRNSREIRKPTSYLSWERKVMGKMCTIVATVLCSTLLLVSIVFIGAVSRLDETGKRYNERMGAEEGAQWELVSAGTVAPAEPSVHFDELKREQLGGRGFESLVDEDLKAENSHVVVKVYSVDSDQELTNDGSSRGSTVRTMKMHQYGRPKEQMDTVHKYGRPKEQMDGRATDRVERKVFAPARSIQDQLANVESGEQQQQPVTKEALLQERFYVEDTPDREPVPPTRRRYSDTFGGKDELSDDSEKEPHRVAPAKSQAVPPFFDYNEQTSQRMLDEFFALRNQDALASRRSNYDWDEGQFRSRTLEEIKNQHRATAASRSKAPMDYLAQAGSKRESDMGYDRYADYAEMEQRMASGFGPHKLGRKQRATPSTGGSSTHVLNRTPIVSTDGDGSMPGKGIERSRFHYSLPSMVFNPYAWDPYHMNMLRFPQCHACQQNARALCGKCGMCSDCCAHSKCTCGCLNG
ncbi:hypothetical protein ZHAS_00014150 [Anopheles sinensis]|uniref:Uncharacterized protein n=1 Tax=Anopheles sinensis TaxID=74873 RepID=A0A084W7F7_ANOSI|nr:hypothetical protein ZHAS_00014150 [Anopheles sinensis]